MSSKIVAGVARRLDWVRPRSGDLPGHRMAVVAPHAMRRLLRLPPHLINAHAPVRNQLNEGSCASFARCGSMEDFRWRMRGLNPDAPEPIEYAEQFVYYNARVKVEGLPADQDTGLTIEAVVRATEDYGACREELHPYGENPLATLSMEPSSEAYADALEHRALLDVWCPTTDEIDAALGMGLTVQFGMELPNCFEDPSVTSSGAMPFDVMNGFISGHSMRIVGQDCTVKQFGETEFYDVQNQWGVDFGIMGRILIPKRYWREGYASSSVAVHRVVS